MGRWPSEDSAAEPPAPRLDDRVRNLLMNNGGRLAFNGLRRALGVHPESLSRALRRLEREGIVQRSENGYALAPSEGVGPEPRTAPATQTIASVQLPAGGSGDAVFGALAGRWFGSLRWVGIYDRPGDPWLVWSVGSSARHVMLSVQAGSLRVLVEGLPGDPTPEAVEAASWELLRQALDRVRPTPRPATPALATLRPMEDDPSSWLGIAG